jgi:hypothetical protein
VSAFRTRVRIKKAAALLRYVDGSPLAPITLSAPVYLEPTGSVSFKVPKAGAFSVKLVCPPDARRFDVPPPSGRLWHLAAADTMIVRLT